MAIAGIAGVTKALGGLLGKGLAGGGGGLIGAATNIIKNIIGGIGKTAQKNLEKKPDAGVDKKQPAAQPNKAANAALQQMKMQQQALLNQNRLLLQQQQQQQQLPLTPQAYMNQMQLSHQMQTNLALLELNQHRQVLPHLMGNYMLMSQLVRSTRMPAPFM